MAAEDIIFSVICVLVVVAAIFYFRGSDYDF